MGDTPSRDASSNDAKVFGGDDAKRMEALKFVDSLQELRHPLRLSFIVSHRNVMAWSSGHKNDWDYFASEAGDPAWNDESVLISLSNAQICTSHPANSRRVATGRTSN
jgi:hypothetical protein